MKSDILECPIEFIEHSIEIGIKLFNGELKDVPLYTDLKRIYFIGQTLCLDIEDEFGFESVIIINWKTETFSYFSGGYFRLLSITALKSLKKLMVEAGIEFKEKQYTY